MSIRNDNLGNPILEDFDELTLKYFNTSPIAQNIIFNTTDKKQYLSSNRLKADRSANIQDLYDMISVLLEKYQMYFIPSAKNPFLLVFPFMLVAPKIGDKIRNLTTDDVYIVKYIPKGKDNRFYGSVLLEIGKTKPLESHDLRFINADGIGDTEKKLVDFYHAYPLSAASPLEDNSGDRGVSQAEPFVPTVVVELRRQEPGTVGKRPFDMVKEAKPRIRETYKHPDDPVNYSIQVRGQWYDNILRFTCFDKTSFGAERLISWFNNFLYKYAWVIKINGIQEMLYWQRRADQNVQVWRNDIVGYPVEWYFRTEEHTIEVIHNITKIDISGRVAWNEMAVTPPSGKNPGEDGLLGPFGNRFASLYDVFHDVSGNYKYGSYNQIDQRNKDTG
jgi:hypothetical protein